MYPEGWTNEISCVSKSDQDGRMVLDLRLEGPAAAWKLIYSSLSQGGREVMEKGSKKVEEWEDPAKQKLETEIKNNMSDIKVYIKVLYKKVQYIPVVLSYTHSMVGIFVCLPSR